MLSVEDNELLCRVGPQTMMGAALRRYWLPACLSTDLPEPDGDPVRLRLLGERFVAFRDSDGTVGVLDEVCPHRGASLVLGRNEDCGLRCVFHGWKFGADGAIQETPNMPDGRFRERLRARACSVRESGGIVWAYLGAPEEQPPLPEYQWAAVPAQNRLIIPVDHDCNYVQSLEGLLDSSHIGVLHTDTMARFAEGEGSQPGTWRSGDTRALSMNNMPRLDVERTDFGFHYAALRNLGDVTQARISAYVAPFLVFIAPAGMAFMAVPLDDTHTRFFNIFWAPDERLVDGPGRDARVAMFGLSDEILAATGMKPVQPECGWIRDRNTFVQDRAAMRAGTAYTGLTGITAEDAAMATSMGAIADRTKEHLVPADLAVIRARRVLLDIAREVAAGNAPLGLTTKTDTRDITAQSGDLQPDEDWHSLVPGHVALGNDDKELAQ